MKQVSRPSLREALRALSMMNVLEVRRGAGACFASLETELLVEHPDFVFFLDDCSSVEHLDARETLDIGIPGLVAQRITGEEPAELETGLVSSQDALRYPVDGRRAEEQLAKAITKSARNPVMSRVADSVGRLRKVSRSQTIKIPGVRAQTAEDQRAIVAVLRRGDPEPAPGGHGPASEQGQTWACTFAPFRARYHEPDHRRLNPLLQSGGSWR